MGTPHHESKQTTGEQYAESLRMSKHVPCPLCGSDCADRAIRDYTVEQAANVFCPTTRSRNRNVRLQEAITRLWGGNEAAIHWCDKCDFGFGWPYVAGDEGFYSIFYEAAGYPSQRWEYGVTRRAVLALIDSDHAPKRIIDIGTGTGEFLIGCNDSWEKFALESSDTLRNFLHKRGINCFPTMKEAVNDSGGMFDVVTMFHVLEHVAPPNEMLKECYELLKPNGRIAISVPDGKRLLRQEELIGMPDMIPNHINKWTPQSLSLMLERSGFVVESARYEPASLWKVRDRAALKVRAKSAAKPNSLAGLSWRIRPRPLRLAVQAVLGGMALVTLLPKVRQLTYASTFLILARKPG